MSAEPHLSTDRLQLRRWHSEDLPVFAAMNADPEVMEYFPATLSEAESAAMIARIEACFDANGFGFWAVEMPGEAEFIGFVGLEPVDPRLVFAPAVEVGWRLARPFWGRGLAAEAARAAVAYGFDELDLAEIVAFTAKNNRRSRRTMERLGMKHDPGEDFNHPRLQKDDPLSAHVLYRIGPSGCPV